MTELERLQRENRILRGLTRDMATLIKELFEHMPDEIQALPSVQRSIDTSRHIIAGLNGLDQRREARDDG